MTALPADPQDAPSSREQPPQAPPPARPPRPPPIPFFMRFPGPVFQKEVWMLGKKPSTAWIRLGYGLVLLVIVSLVFAAQGFPRGETGAAALQRYQEVAPAITVAVSTVQFILLTLIGIALGGPAVCDEKRMGTFGTLLTTPLKAWQIVLGKLMGRGVELVIITLLSAPLLLAARSFGGVSGGGVVMLSVECILSALLAVQVAMLMSTLMRRPTGAMICALLVLAAVYFGPILIEFTRQAIKSFSAGNRASPFNPGFILLTSPPVVLGMLIAELMSGEQVLSRIGFTMMQAWMLHAAYLLAIFACFFWLTCLALRSALAREASGAPEKAARATPTSTASQQVAPTTPMHESAGSVQGTTSTPYRPRGRPAQHAGYSRVVGDSPVLWRELQQRALPRPWLLWTILGVLLLVIVLITYVSQFDEAALYAIASILTVAALLVACVASTGTISGEREGRTLDVLLCTPLPSRAIVWSKLAGAARRMGVLIILVLLHILVFGVLAKPVGIALQVSDSLFFRLRNRWDADAVHIVALLHVPMILCSSIFFLLATGVYFSTRFRKSMTATVCNFALVVMLWAFLPIGGAMVSEAIDHQSGMDGDVVANVVLAPNPVFLTVTSLVGAQELHQDLSDGSGWMGSAPSGWWTGRAPLVWEHGYYDFPRGSLSFLPFTILVFVVSGAYWLVGAYALHRASKHLREVPGSSGNTRAKGTTPNTQA